MFKSNLIIIYAAIVLLLSGCGGGGGGGDSSSSGTTTGFSLPTITSDGVPCVPTGATVQISGTINYQRVLFSATAGAGLDYNNIQSRPVRGAVIQALGNGDCIMATGITSATGTYSLAVSQGDSVKIRVKAQLLSTTGAIWNFEVRDNTNSNGLYVLDGSFANAGSTNSTRNLTATSGWTGSSYGGVRASGPFAILDSIFDSIQKVIGIDASVNMDDADIFWSINNSTANGSLSAGEIGGSFYSNDQIYILGKENNDTDEFDTHIVIHEWGHYFEDNLSRSDSIGGSHTVTSKLDLRLAFSEGFANALSGIVTDDPAYRDSFGNQQGNDFEINVETNATTNIGWFNEGAVQTIIYDIHDTTSDANDSVSLGFSAIYNAMVSSTYRNQSSATSIFSLINKVKTDNAGVSGAIDTLVSSQGIDVIIDQLGSNETNSGGNANNLPVYKLLTDNGATVTVCSDNSNGETNRLGNRQLIQLTVASAGNHNIVATRTSGLASSDPDIRVFLDGALRFSGSSSTNNTETISASLNADVYILEVFHFGNIDGSSSTGGNVCFNVSVS